MELPQSMHQGTRVNPLFGRVWPVFWRGNMPLVWSSGLTARFSRCPKGLEVTGELWPFTSCVRILHPQTREEHVPFWDFQHSPARWLLLDVVSDSLSGRLGGVHKEDILPSLSEASHSICMLVFCLYYSIVKNFRIFAAKKLTNKNIKKK